MLFILPKWKINAALFYQYYPCHEAESHQVKLFGQEDQRGRQRDKLSSEF